MSKWISKLLIGVLAGILAGVGVWVITRGLGPPSVALTPQIPESIEPSRVFPVSFSAENQRDTTEAGCGGYVSLQQIDLEDPVLRRGGRGQQPDTPALSESILESAAREMVITVPERETSEADIPEPRLPGTRLAPAPAQAERPDPTKVPRITRQPELIEKPELLRPSPLERSAVFAKCNTEDREFVLDPVGSRISIAARCVVRQAGDYRMIYGVRCKAGSDGEWAIQGEAEFNVHEP